ncbi:MAG: fimbrillin family protein, partial [Bacteroidales bacterium]|nr:fimbrillin family protein [Bacteroidales bacterium]
MKKFLVCIIALAAVVACHKDNGPKHGSAVKFSVAVEPYFATKATDTALEAGDRLTVFAGEPIDATALGTYNGSSLILDKAIYWNAGQKESTVFAAVYQKYGTVKGGPVFKYNLAEGWPYSFVRHNVFMVAATEAAPGSPVNFTLKHPFSRINILINNTTGEAISKVTMEGVILEATLDIQEKTLELGHNRTTFQAATLATNSYAVIIMPQTVAPTVTVTTASGETYRFTQSPAFTFESGKAYSTELTLEKAPATGAPVSLTFTVVPWTDGEALDYDNVSLQSREVHFAKEEKRLRYKLLRSRLE